MRNGHAPQIVQPVKSAGIPAISAAYAKMPVKAGVANDHAAPLYPSKIKGSHNSAKLAEVGTGIFLDFRRLGDKEDTPFTGHCGAETRRGFVNNHKPSAGSFQRGGER